nr:hypothetical protein [Paenarthrobacter ureafaciens]
MGWKAWFMGLGGQVVVERAGTPGAAAAMDAEAGAGVGRAGVAITTAGADNVGTAPGFAAANGGGPSGAGSSGAAHPSGVGSSDRGEPTGVGSSSSDVGLSEGMGLSDGGGGVVEDVMEALEDGAAVLETARALALPAGRVFDVQEAADFAARVEDLELVNTFVYEGSGFSPSRVRCVRGM